MPYLPRYGMKNFMEFVDYKESNLRQIAANQGWKQGIGNAGLSINALTKSVPGLIKGAKNTWQDIQHQRKTGGGVGGIMRSIVNSLLLGKRGWTGKNETGYGVNPKLIEWIPQNRIEEIAKIVEDNFKAMHADQEDYNNDPNKMWRLPPSETFEQKANHLVIRWIQQNVEELAHEVATSAGQAASMANKEGQEMIDKGVNKVKQGAQTATQMAQQGAQKGQGLMRRGWDWAKQKWKNRGQRQQQGDLQLQQPQDEPFPPLYLPPA